MEYCGKLKTHDYELYLGINDIEHTKPRTRHPQTNVICECFHEIILHEFYQLCSVANYTNPLEELQADLDEWLEYYNTERTHLGNICCG